MKRDIDLMREILMQVEAHPAGEDLSSQGVKIPGHDPVTISEHVWLLKQAHLIEATFPGDSPSRGVFVIFRLTPEGHDFVAHAHQSELWEKAKGTAARMGVGVTVDVMKKLLIEYAGKAIGLL